MEREGGVGQSGVREGGGENGEILTIVVCVARSIEYLALDFLGLRN